MAIQSEKEFMLYSLYRQLQIPVPETALLVLTNVFGEDPNYYYAVQASEAVSGESALEACKNQETVFEEKAFVEQVIGTLLTNPSEGSLKNSKYNYHYKTLVSVDNGLVFKPEFMGDCVNVKSILYLLPQMDLSIPESVKTFFTSLDLHLTTLSWLQSLSQKNEQYKILFKRLAFQKTRCSYQSLRLQDKTPSLEACLQEKVHVDSEFHGDSFYPQILVSKSLLSDVQQKLQMIGKILKKNGFISAQILFEEISPVLGKYYRKLRLEFSDIEEAEKALLGKEINGVNYCEVKSLLSPEEFEGLLQNKNSMDENVIPEMFFNEYKKQLVSGESPLDQFIKRHNQRIKRNSLNLREVLEDLQLLIQEGLTASQSPRDILDFLGIISKMNESLVKEITFLLSNLPNAELKWLLTLEKYFLTKNDISVKPSSVAVAGVFLKEKVFNLSESEHRYLFDPQGNIKKDLSLSGRLNVTCFPAKDPEFYLKQYPEFPGYEFASTLLMRLLGIKCLPYHDLLIIKNSYPVLISQDVRGNPVHKIWNNSLAFNKLDPVHTALLIISAMLINPEDGKEDNFILSDDGKYLIPIDNDHYFLPSTFQKKGDFWNFFTVNAALQTKTLLFSLQEMKRPIPVEVKEHILSIDFDNLLKEWLIELDKVQDEYKNLIQEDQRQRFSEHGTITNIFFYEQFISHMHWKAHKIQHLLTSANETTPFDLLKVIEPFVAKSYESSFGKGNDLQTRFKAATDSLYTKPPVNGSRASIQDTRSMMDIIDIPEKDLQNHALFRRMEPVYVRKLLDQLIEERSEKAKREQELLFELDDENQEMKWIHLFGKSQTEEALKSFFANPKEGLQLKGSKLVTSSKLKDLFSMAPGTGMKIRYLSLPKSPRLASKEIKILTRECPCIEYLNVSGCSKLNEIVTAKGEWPLLARLEAWECLNLEKFVCYSPIKILRIGTGREMELFVEKSALDIYTISTKINEFDFVFEKGNDLRRKHLEQIPSRDRFIQSALLQMKKFDEFFGPLKMTIGMHSIISPRDLAVFLTSIEFSSSNVDKKRNFQKLVRLKPINLKSLTLSSCKNAEGIILEELIQADWPKLNYLNLSNTRIGDAGLKLLSSGKWPLLEDLDLSNTGIEEEGIQSIISSWENLKRLDVSVNPRIFNKKLGSLALGKWSLLECLIVNGVDILADIETLVNKSSWPNLKEIKFNLERGGDRRWARGLIAKKWPEANFFDNKESLKRVLKEDSWHAVPVSAL